MGRLWVRLSVAFALVALMVDLFFAVAFLVVFQSGAIENGLVADLSAPGGLIERLSRYYAEHGTWEGIALIREEGAGFVPGLRGGLIITLQDANETPVYDPIGATNLPRFEVSDRIGILVNGQVVGRLVIYRRVMPKPPDSLSFEERVGRIILIVAGFSLFIGVLAGVIVSRYLSMPLNRLARAVQRLSPRALSHRLKEENPTEVAQTARAFNDLLGRLEQGEALRRNMVTDIAHELRTPLTVLQGSLSAMLQGTYNIDRAEVGKLYDQTRLLRRLVTDLHELTQAEAHQLPLNRELLDLTEVIEGLVESFRALTDLHDLTLVAVLPPPPVYVRADSARLGQIVNNLLMNALQHTPEGGQITVRVVPEGGYVNIHVQDTGAGIASEHLPHIFERFYRADPSRQRETGGVGLGLAIVKALTEAHGGVVSALSAGVPGTGTLFTVRLPAQPT